MESDFMILPLLLLQSKHDNVLWRETGLQYIIIICSSSRSGGNSSRMSHRTTYII